MNVFVKTFEHFLNRFWTHAGTRSREREDGRTSKISQTNQ